MRVFTKIIVSFILLISLAKCNNVNDEKCEDFRVIEKQKKLLVGQWVDKRTRIDASIYEFNSDDTWKWTFIYDGETRIKKGKYVLGNDHEVFLRYFGIQHWPNNDTINDYKTSLSARLFFLYDTVLVNNQEDYTNEYIKTK